MNKQLANTVLMVSPDDFGFNPDTAITNPFANNLDNPQIQTQAMIEFDNLAKAIESKGIKVIRMSSRRDIKTPDAVFPNNWFSTHENIDGKPSLILYPMLIPNRRAERRHSDLVQTIKANNLRTELSINITTFEDKNRALEGTGSIVFDRENKIAYACISVRTDREILEILCEQIGFKPVTFKAYDKNDELMYHTNLMMSIGKEFAIICTNAIKDESEKRMILESLKSNGKIIIEISEAQRDAMCANILQLENQEGKKFILMSQNVYDNFTKDQIQQIEKFGEIIKNDISTIEKIGGGSARCMVAEIFQ